MAKKSSSPQRRREDSGRTSTSRAGRAQSGRSRTSSEGGSRRGFAAMSLRERREIAARGGRASHGGRGRDYGRTGRPTRVGAEYDETRSGGRGAGYERLGEREFSDRSGPGSRRRDYDDERFEGGRTAQADYRAGDPRRGYGYGGAGPHREFGGHVEQGGWGRGDEGYGRGRPARDEFGRGGDYREADRWSGRGDDEERRFRGSRSEYRDYDEDDRYRPAEGGRRDESRDYDARGDWDRAPRDWHAGERREPGRTAGSRQGSGAGQRRDRRSAPSGSRAGRRGR